MDGLALTETWIKLSRPHTIKRDLAPPEFNAFHTHRLNDRQGGGVALIVRMKTLLTSFFSLPYLSCELLAILLMTSSGRLNIITLYQPLTRSTAFYSELHDLLDDIDGLPGRPIIRETSTVLHCHLLDFSIITSSTFWLSITYNNMFVS